MFSMIPRLFPLSSICLLSFLKNELLQKEDVETAGSGETSGTNEPGVEVSVIHTISKTLQFSHTCLQAIPDAHSGK